VQRLALPGAQARLSYHRPAGRAEGFAGGEALCGGARDRDAQRATNDQVAAFGGDSAADKHDLLER